LSEDATPLSEIIAGGSIGEYTLIGRPGQVHEKTCRVLENATSAYFISKSVSLFRLFYHHQRFECFHCRAVFEEFCWQHPREFTSWVQTAVARAWRVASYTLHQFLVLPELSRLQHVRFRFVFVFEKKYFHFLNFFCHSTARTCQCWLAWRANSFKSI
jgi:hypothetical protein